MADRIIETRKKHGPFTSIDDIVSVPGIGNITLQEIRPFVQPILDSSYRKVIHASP